MDRLERSLRERLREEPTRVPASVDAAVLEYARRHRPHPFGASRWIVGLAASAAAMLLLWLSLPPAESRRERLDMVDAYRLALRIEGGADFDPRWDRNGDGVLDARDVESIARDAVSLDAEDHS